MKPILLAFALVCAGCEMPDDTLEGMYEAYVRDGDLNSSVQVDMPNTTITVHLWEDWSGDLQGEALLYGDLELYGYDVYNFDRGEWYPAKNIHFDRATLQMKGAVEVPKIPTPVGFKAELPPNYAWMELELNHFGTLILYKVDLTDEEEQEEEVDDA